MHSTKTASENLKKLTGVKGLSPYVNPALGNRFSPGSTFKILDLVTGLESGKYDMDTPVPNPQQVNIQARRSATSPRASAPTGRRRICASSPRRAATRRSRR
ncbi:penicillin-binding transpeptidase domain-containing protein [Arthrobacter sp. JCM 19049]|uniref:penicillin-binding transpeptidase domain-containing protein n=1 Tax=Arthrobacter sp. JCM 19049 TaxID=1460643 RepID=UPI0006CFDBA4|nr:penicillin-binding transpeptidase domain-containing protein [Arthrobacter sp. JCM 19049]